MKRIAVSPNVINRLPKYINCLERLKWKEVDRVSSAQLAEMLESTPSQVRQDFALFGNYGAQGYGYKTDYLLQEIKAVIGLNMTHNIAVIGVGSIGRALLEHIDFNRYNYRVCAAFDVDSDKIGSEIKGVEIYDINDLKSYMKMNKIDIAMLTVSPTVAKQVAAQLCDMGVRAIWNFTGEALGLPSDKILIQNVSFLDSLFTLTYRLENE